MGQYDFMWYVSETGKIMEEGNSLIIWTLVFCEGYHFGDPLLLWLLWITMGFALKVENNSLLTGLKGQFNYQELLSCSFRFLQTTVVATNKVTVLQSGRKTILNYLFRSYLRMPVAYMSMTA